MEHVERKQPVAELNVVSPRTSTTQIAPRNALVLYGSETGNAQDVAEEVGNVTERLRFDTTVLDLDSVQLRDVVKSTVVVFVVSTTGQGEFPQNARAFWNRILSTALKPGILRKLRFASFGLGDSSYAQYNVAHRMLHGRLLQLGAQSFCDRGEGNEQHPEGHHAGYREWIVKLSQGLAQTFPLPDGLTPIANDIFIEPRWKLDLTLAGKSEDQSEEGKGINKSCNADEPSSSLLPIVGSHIASVSANARVTPNTHFQDVRLLDLRLDKNIQYGPGAVAVIYPKNFPDDVQSFITLMAWEEIADQPIHLIPNDPRSSSSPSPLRYLDLNNVTVTMRWLLENVLDIMSIPRRSFFANLIFFAGTSNDDEAYQKERLHELANPELIDELWDYTTRPKRTILEVMMDFTTLRIPWQYALSVLPLMRGRQFSIASGGALRTDEHGATRLQLLIAIVDPPSPIIKWRRRYGVCTRYVATLRTGQTLSVGVQAGYLDVRASELAVPVLMVGPGTGVAPMRSMIYQRLHWAAAAAAHNARNPSVTGTRLAGDVLFFGCRNAAADHFFRDEWEELARTEGLEVCTAVSRDADRPREYVQDRIRARGPLVREALLRRNGKVYVCGSSGNMPKGVRQAFLDVLVDGGSGMSLQEAEAFLESMEKDGRYKQETW